MTEVKPKILIGLVGGSDLGKILEQMGGSKGLFSFPQLFWIMDYLLEGGVYLTSKLSVNMIIFGFSDRRL